MFLVMVWWCGVKVRRWFRPGTGGNLVVVAMTPQGQPQEIYDAICRLGRLLRQVYPCTDRGHPAVHLFPQANQENCLICFCLSSCCSFQPPSSDAWRSSSSDPLLPMIRGSVISIHEPGPDQRAPSAPSTVLARPPAALTVSIVLSRNRTSSRHKTRPALSYPFRLHPVTALVFLFPGPLYSPIAEVPLRHYLLEKTARRLFLVLFGPGIGLENCGVGHINRWWWQLALLLGVWEVTGRRAM